MKAVMQTRIDPLIVGSVVAVRLDSRSPWRQAVLVELRQATVVVRLANGAPWELWRAPRFVRPVRVAWCRECDGRVA